MSEPSSAPDLLSRLAHEFAERLRRGEQPTPSEYAGKYPELAADIRDLFPTLAVMEGAGVAERSAGAAVHDQRGAAPERLGEYRILREIGRGGMGIVYEAVQESLGRHVALKVLSLPRLTGHHHERFEREARAAALLHHSNIVPVFGVGAHDGVAYYAMQFILGQALDSVLLDMRCLPDARPSAGEHDSLRALLAKALFTGSFDPAADTSRARDSQPPVASANSATAATGIHARPAAVTGRPAEHFRGVARLGQQVAEALAHAHQQGVLHRDIKPANVLLDTHGTAWVTDFGLARVEGAAELTSPGDIVGTLRYMPPERFSAAADARGDIYSLGLTLYELLTLRPAFDEPDRGRLIKRITHEEPARPRQLDRRIPRDLETVVLKAIAKEPARRYQTAAALADDLQRFLADRPVQARRARLLERTWRWCRRNRAAAALIATLLVSAIAGGVLSWLLGAALDEADEARRQAVADRKEKTEQLWQSLLERARAGRFSRRVGQRYGSLAALAEAARIKSDERLRDEAIFAMTLPDLRPGPEWGIDDLQSSPRPKRETAWAFDGNYRLYAKLDGGFVSIRRVADRGEVQRVEAPGPGVKMTFSADGQLLCLTSGDLLRVHRVADGKLTLSPKEPIRLSDNCAFSPDGRLVAVSVAPLPGKSDVPILCFDLHSGNMVGEWVLPGGTGRLAFAPDSKRLAVSSTHAFVVLSADNGWKPGNPISSPDPVVLAWHPDGVRLAIADSTSPPRLQIWDAQRGVRLLSLDGHNHTITHLSFHPDGQLLASASSDGHLRLWHAQTGRPLLAHDQAAAPRFSPDGRWLGTMRSGNRVQLMEVATSAALRTVVARQRLDRGISREGAVSPDGQWLAHRFGLGPVLWHLPSGRELAQLPDLDHAQFGRDASRPELLMSLNGIMRWPMSLADKPGHWRIGPPRTLVSDKAPSPGYAFSPDGRTVVVGDPATQEVRIVDRATDKTLAKLQGSAGMASYIWSADGRWIAGFSSTGRLLVWDAARRQKVYELPTGPARTVVFSHDGRLLALTTPDEFTFVETGTWQVVYRLPREQRSLPPHVAFAPDGRLLALELTPGIIHLLDVSKWKTIARLEGPGRERTGWLAFTPDGSRLVVSAPYAPALHIWNLAAVRGSLKGMGLDWDSPQLKAGQDAPPPTFVEVLPLGS